MHPYYTYIYQKDHTKSISGIRTNWYKELGIHVWFALIYSGVGEDMFFKLYNQVGRYSFYVSM